jgi:hypothetical protein
VHHRDRVAVLETEGEKLSDLVEKEKQQIETLEQIIAVIDRSDCREIIVQEANPMFGVFQNNDPDPDSNGVAGPVSGSGFAIRIRIQEGKNDPQT